MQQPQTPHRSNNFSLFTLNSSLLIISFCLALSSCDPEKIYESNVNIPAHGWHSGEFTNFTVDITDTVSLCNIFINVRNNSKYKYMDLWLFVDIHSPLGYMERDTINIMLADHRGKWLGYGLGNKFDTRIYLRRNVRFPVIGEYVFEYEQAMRDEVLIGIEDIGLRIERMN